LNNKFKTKLQALSKGKIDRSNNVSPSALQQDYNKILKTADNQDNDIDYIEVKLNRNIYNNDQKKTDSDINKRFKLENKENKNDNNFKRIINNNETKDNKIILNPSKHNNNLFITKVNDEEDDNDSVIEMPKSKNNNQFQLNAKNMNEFTIGSYASSDVRNNFANESGFISNANDLENFSIKIKHSNN